MRNVNRGKDCRETEIPVKKLLSYVTKKIGKIRANKSKIR